MKSSYSKTELIKRLQALEEISVDLIRPQNAKNLLRTIVERAVNLFSCDAGSLYLKGDNNTLFFEVAVNDSIHFEFERRSVPLTDKGLANFVFRTGTSLRIKDVYKISSHSPFVFDSGFDELHSYRTRSVLVQPLKNSRGEMVGVLQLINKKPRKSLKWPSAHKERIARMPHFSLADQRLLESFAAVASASLENTQLQKDIENLFEGFVRASVHAIESRDLVTRGHSDRVALLTVQLARSVSDSRDSEVRDVVFNEAQLSELRYAALLHDFGKIGVRESTLQKEEKLSPEQKLEIKSRLEDFRSTAEIRALREFIHRIMQQKRVPSEIELAQIDRQIREFSHKLDEYWGIILGLNRPTVLSEDKSKALEDLRHVCCKGRHGELPLLTRGEAISLSIRKGSLSEEERLEIESHVTHSFEFLKKIPWTQELARVPEIAFAHHEKLDGSGYPRRVKAPEIPDQARIMTITDIFDALTAKDRPYKKAVPTEKALDILFDEAKRGSIDARFLRVFVEAKVYESEDFLKLSLSTSKKAA